MARNRFEKPAAVVTFQRADDGSVKAVLLNGKPMPFESIEHAMQYGVNQWCQDGGAGAIDQAAYTAGFNSRLERLLSGEVGRARGEGREPADPIEASAKSIARQALRAAVDPTVWKALSKEQKAEAFNAYYSANREEFRKEAERAAKNVEKISAGSDLLAKLLPKGGKR